MRILDKNNGQDNEWNSKHPTGKYALWNNIDISIQVDDVRAKERGAVQPHADMIK